MSTDTATPMTTNTTRIACTDLNTALVGQWVKKGSTKYGVQSVEQIVAVHKNGNVKLDKWSVFKPEPNGSRAYKTGEGNRIGGYTIISAFAEGETVDAVREALIAANAARIEERKAKEAAQEAETQAKIEAACIVHSNGRDIPGSKVARWYDAQGNARITLYFVKAEQMYGGMGYNVRIADFENGSFGSSYATSMVDGEDAINRWIASWYGPLAK